MTKEITEHGFETYDYVGTEIAPFRSGCRFDVVGIKSRENIVKIMEVKSCRMDFLTDKKWQKYLQYATHFYFVAPTGAIYPDELPDGVGLIEFGALDLRNPFWNYTKRSTRLPKIDDKKHIKLLEAVIYSVNREKRK